MTLFEENRNQAVAHFRRVWSRAHLQDILARLAGRSNDLIAFEDVRRSLKGRLSGRRELPGALSVERGASLGPPHTADHRPATLWLPRIGAP